MSNFITNLLLIKDQNITMKDKLDLINVDGQDTFVFHGTLSYNPKCCPNCGCKKEENEDTYVELAEEITIDKFFETSLRVAEVLECEKVKKSSKLLKFKLDLGNHQRQIVSGIAKYYDPAELVGKKVAVVANLKPVKLCGELSEGMILSAEKDGILRVVEINAEIPNGAEIR